MESEDESDSGVASLALATAYVAKSIFNTEDNGFITYADVLTRTTPLPPIASWHAVPRKNPVMLTFNHQLKMTLIVNLNPATKHLLKLLLNNKGYETYSKTVRQKR